MLSRIMRGNTVVPQQPTTGVDSSHYTTSIWTSTKTTAPATIPQDAARRSLWVVALVLLGDSVIDTPSGWTEIKQNQDNDISLGYFCKVVDDPSIEGQVDLIFESVAGGALVSFVVQSGLYDAAGNIGYHSGGAPNPQAYTATESGYSVVVSAVEGGSATPTPPSGWTNRIVYGGSSISIVVCDKSGVAAGSVDAGVLVWDVSNHSMAGAFQAY